MAATLLELCVCLCAVIAAAQAKRPNIVFIVADDLGWNDVSLHGSPQIPTPNIDAIAKKGVELTNYHVQPVCSPTRSTFLSGRHVIHTGIYMPFSQGTSLRLNVSYTLLPEYLKKVGYKTAAIGKWHLGQNVMKALPTGRGFDEYLGYWSGAEDYYTHMVKGGYDFQDGTACAPDYNGTYSTYTFAERAVKTIQAAGKNQSDPLFLYLAFQNVHWPLQAPQKYLDRFTHIPNQARQYVAAMTAILDEAVGNVTQAIDEHLPNTLVVFTSDNGGPVQDEGTMSNNYPLRGGKNTIWNGGTNVVGMLAGAGIDNPGRVSHEKMHASDWLPSLVSMACDCDWQTLIPEQEAPFIYGDGMNVWDMLATGAASPREWILHEAHPTTMKYRDSVHGNGLTIGHWKIVNLQIEPEPGWYPPPGQDPSSTPYTIDCGDPPTLNPHECRGANNFCLFNITADPCEHHNLAQQYPDVVREMRDALARFQATAVPPVVGQGCDPLINDDGCWRPCDD